MNTQITYKTSTMRSMEVLCMDKINSIGFLSQSIKGNYYFLDLSKGLRLSKHHHLNADNMADAMEELKNKIDIFLSMPREPRVAKI